MEHHLVKRNGDVLQVIAAGPEGRPNQCGSLRRRIDIGPLHQDPVHGCIHTVQRGLQIPEGLVSAHSVGGKLRVQLRPHTVQRQRMDACISGVFRQLPEKFRDGPGPQQIPGIIPGIRHGRIQSEFVLSLSNVRHIEQDVAVPADAPAGFVDVQQICA